MLYHSEVFMPRKLLAQVPKGTIDLSYTKHAINASAGDRYGRIKLPPRIAMGAGEVFEIDERCRVVQQFAVRLTGYHEHPDFDISMVVMVRKGRYIVKTVWLNHKNDKHKTLKKENYATR